MAWPTTAIILQPGSSAAGYKILNPDTLVPGGPRAVEDSNVPYAAGLAAGGGGGGRPLPTTGQLWPR